LINGLCVKNGTERAGTCKLQLSLQPRFIARFNQLVSITSQPWDSSKQKSEPEAQANEGEEDVHVQETGEVEAATEGEYEEYEGDEHAEDVQEYDEDTADQVEGEVKPDETEAVDENVEEAVESTHEEGLAAADDDELYEENDEDDLPVLSPIEITLDEEDLEGDYVDEVEHVEVFEEQAPEEYDAEQGEYHDDPGGYDDIHGEEEHHGEEVQGETEADETAEASEHPLPSSTQQGIASAYYRSLSSSDTGENGAEDDLISYEEAVDQAEDGQEYRQQYLDETATSAQHNGETNGEHIDQTGEVNETVGPQDGEVSTAANAPSPNSKRPLNEVVDSSIEDQAPRKLLRGRH
jgi:hypothetical protein